MIGPAGRKRGRAGQHDEPEDPGARRIHHHHGGVHSYFENKKKYPPGMWEQVLRSLKKVETAMG